MSSTITSRLDEHEEPDGSAGVARSEPGGTQGMTHEIGDENSVLGP
jgi:hypothetical protein